MADFFLYKYSGKETKTVDEFLKDKNIPIEINSSDFLKFSGDDENDVRTNADLIFDKYTSPIVIQENEENYAWFNSDLQIEPGTVVKFPKDNTTLEEIALLSENQYLQQGEFKAYLGQHETLLNDNDYVRSEQTIIKAKSIDLKLINETIKVWIWVRAIDKIVDVTPFINFLNVSKNIGTGNFSFSMSPVANIEEVIATSYDDYVNLFGLNSSEGLNMDFFEKRLQQNDVVFIRFEQLEMDKFADSKLNKRSLIRENGDLFVSDGETSDSIYNGDTGQRIKNKVSWDMIGLIDKVQASYTAQTSERNIVVNGSDLMKLLTEDASYFIPFKFVEGVDDKNKMLWSGDNTDNWFKRNFISGSFDFFFSYEMKGIGESLEFIVNHLSNLGVTPNRLWDAYGDNRTKTYKVRDDKDKAVEKLNVNGIWQIVKIAMDKNLDSRVISGESLINPDGNLFSFFNTICQRPFVEFWGDTFRDTFDFVVRQPPYTKKAIQDVWRNNLYTVVEEKDVYSYDLAFDNTYYSHYKIMPSGMHLGADLGTIESIIPIVYLPQFADVFGNRKLEIQDMYLSRQAWFGLENGEKTEDAFKSILNDYKFMIETNSYLPFTRQGMITISGDRRIKTGSFIYFKPTDELFVVEGVTNTFSASRNELDRKSIVTVKRGMKIHGITGGLADVDNKIVELPGTYFDIVNTDVIVKNILRKLELSGGGQTQQNTSLISTNFGVNESVFDFYLNRKHF